MHDTNSLKECSANIIISVIRYYNANISQWSHCGCCILITMHTDCELCIVLLYIFKQINQWKNDHDDAHVHAKTPRIWNSEFHGALIAYIGTLMSRCTSACQDGSRELLFELIGRVVAELIGRGGGRANESMSRCDTGVNIPIIRGEFCILSGQ